MTGELPECGSLWVYCGPEEGRGELHQVIASGEGGVITWGREKHTWSGNPDLFCQQFNRVEEPAA